jgi:hypothetical protein
VKDESSNKIKSIMLYIPCTHTEKNIVSRCVFIVPTVKIEQEKKRNYYTKKVGQMGKVGILQSRKTRKEIDVRSASLHFVQECKMKHRRGRNCFL